MVNIPLCLQDGIDVFRDLEGLYTYGSTYRGILAPKYFLAAVEVSTGTQIFPEGPEDRPDRVSVGVYEEQEDPPPGGGMEKRGPVGPHSDSSGICPWRRGLPTNASQPQPERGDLPLMPTQYL